MLGHSHATMGALAWAAAAPLMPHLAGIHLGVADTVMGVFLTAGAALLPDLDHQDGTIAHFFGPVSHTFCRFVNWISGGHRHATHSFFFVALVGFGTWAGVHYWARPFTLAMTVILLGLAIRALHLCPPGKGIHAWGTVAVLTAGGTVIMDKWLPSAPQWLPWAIGIGTLAHLAGDCLTERGCPLLWPIRQRFGIPLISHTGNHLETWILSPLMTLGTMVVLYFTVVPST